jgi:hypothetical protein
MLVRTVTIPRISNYSISTLEKMVPGVTLVAPIPLIETEEKAVDVATRIIEDSLVRYECIKEVKEVMVLSTGWLITFSIFN